MAQFLLGATMLGWCVAGLVFLRFWRRTHDRFFLLFALSFWLEALTRVVLAAFPEQSEDNPVFYVGRLIGYGLILLAIWQKNRPRR
jgi:hypothetical protein